MFYHPPMIPCMRFHHMCTHIFPTPVLMISPPALRLIQPASTPSKHKPSPDLLSPIKLLVQQMQQQVDIEPHVPLKQRHKLMSLELSLEQVLNGHQRTSTRNLDMTPASLEGKDADLVARDGEVDLAPFTLGNARPRDKYALVREGARAVLV